MFSGPRKEILFHYHQDYLHWRHRWYGHFASPAIGAGEALLVERFFSIPGMGPLLTDSITRYDLNMVRGLVLLYALLGIFGLFLGDVLMTVCDPRIRLTGKGGDTR